MNELKVKGRKLGSSSQVSFSSDICTKMMDELATVMDMFHAIKKAGRSATLTLSTISGKATKVKLAFELDDGLPIPTTSASSSPAAASSTRPESGRCQQRRGPAKKAKARARAAEHRASLAASAPSTGATSASPVPGEAPSPPASNPQPPPPPPPPPATCRKVTTVERKTSTWPTFSQLDGDEPDMEGVCETCDDHHEVKEGCYFYCIGDNRCCMKVITPYCGDCKWRRRKQIAQQGTNNDHNT